MDDAASVEIMLCL